MADYTKTTDFVAKDLQEATVQGALWDTEYDAIATSLGTKADKVTSPASNKLVATDGSSVLSSSGSFKELVGNTIAQQPVFTGAPDAVSESLSGTIERVRITYANLSSSGSNGARVLIGTSGSLMRSGYTYAAFAYSAHVESASAIGFPVVIDADSGQNASGICDLYHMGSNLWFAVLQSIDLYPPPGGTPRTSRVIGQLQLSGPLDIIGIGTYLYDTMDLGYWSSTYYRSA